MTKAKNRKIVVDGHQYLWNRAHIHKLDGKQSTCVEILTVYLDGKKASPLKIYFSEKGAQYSVGCPDQGVIWNEENIFNLNRPGVVAEFIRHGISAGWIPHGSNKSFEIKNGIELINYLDFPD
jgi:hypothetical protein